MADPQQNGQMRAGGRMGAFVRESGYLRKWLILGVSIGIIAGLGAVVFFLAMKYAGEFLLGSLGGYQQPQANGDGGGSGSPDSADPGRFP